MIVTEPPSSTPAEDLFQQVRRPDLGRFLLRAQKAIGLLGEVTVLLCGDGRIRELNKAFRGKNKATDVLSFPPGEHAGETAGDLAISVETAARQAAEHGHTLQEELRVLILHGTLHLAGFDHEADAGEMRTRETELRAQLKLPVGLIERTVGQGTRRRSAVRTSTTKPALARAE